MKTKIIRTQQVTYVDYTYSCSRCQRPAGDDEAKGVYDVREVVLMFESGTTRRLTFDPEAQLEIKERKKVRLLFKDGKNYGGDGAAITAQVIDCCSACWRDAVVPALLALGFEVREEDLGW